WSSFLDHPLDGTGAGSFVLVHRPRRSTSLDVTTEPHNVPLQFLGETGIVGFLLFGGAAVAAALGLRATLRRLDDDDRAAALAVEPLLVWAGIEGSAGNIPEAKRLYRKAVRLKPKDAEAWFEFGEFELKVDCFPLRAYQYLNRSYTLDPFGPTSRKGGPLDEAPRLDNKEAGKTGKAPCG